MKPYQSNLLNAVVLIVMGLWGYLSSDEPSNTALIPVAFGVLFAAVTQPFKNENKIVAHVVVLLTFLLILSLFMPLSGVIQRKETMGIIRVGLMILTSSYALFTFIKSFVDARKARSQSAKLTFLNLGINQISLFL